MVEINKKVAGEETQQQYSEENFRLLLSSLQGESQTLQIVEQLRTLAEFICYSEQYSLSYFDILMSTNLLLVDMPNYLAMDERRVNIQLI
jgi:hypothetical protein